MIILSRFIHKTMHFEDHSLIINWIIIHKACLKGN